MQTKYPEHAFTVVLSNAQIVDDEMRAFPEEKAKGIAVYDHINPPNYPCGPGIPDAYLFDHTGRLVETGRPYELYPLVEGLVMAVLPPGILGAF